MAAISAARTTSQSGRRTAKRAALRPRLPFEDLSEEWTLELWQQRIAACETLLLCMPPELESLNKHEQMTLRAMTANVLGSKGPTVESLAAGLAHEGVGEDIRPYLHYRLLLLLQKQPHTFATPQAFTEWATRQLAIFSSGLIGVVRTSRHQQRPRTPTVGPSPTAGDGGRPQSEAPLAVLRACIQRVRATLAQYEDVADRAQAAPDAALAGPVPPGTPTGEPAAPAGPDAPSPLAADAAGGGADGVGGQASLARLASDPASSRWFAMYRPSCGTGEATAAVATHDHPVALLEVSVREWTREYEASLRELQELTWSLYAQLSDEATSAAVFEHRLPLGFPVNLKHYGILLLATFDAEHGTPLAQTEDAIALLQRPRAALFPRDATAIHLVCLAEATFVIHCERPDAVELAEAVKNRVKDATAALERAMVLAGSPAAMAPASLMQSQLRGAGPQVAGLMVGVPPAVPDPADPAEPMAVTTRPPAESAGGAASVSAVAGLLPRCAMTPPRGVSAELRGCLSVLEAMRSHFGYLLSSLHRHFPAHDERGQLRPRKILDNVLDAHVFLFTMHASLSARRGRQRALTASLRPPACASGMSACGAPPTMPPLIEGGAAEAAGCGKACGAAGGGAVPQDTDGAERDGSDGVDGDGSSLSDEALRKPPPPPPVMDAPQPSSTHCGTSPSSASPILLTPRATSCCTTAPGSGAQSAAHSLTQSPRLEAAGGNGAPPSIAAAAAAAAAAGGEQTLAEPCDSTVDIRYEAWSSLVKPLVVPVRGLNAASPAAAASAATPGPTPCRAGTSTSNLDSCISSAPMAYSVSSGTTPPASPVAPKSAELSIVGVAAAPRPLFFTDATFEPSLTPKAAAGASAVRDTGNGMGRKMPAVGGGNSLSACFLSTLGLTRRSAADVRREGDRGLEGLALRAVHLYGRSSPNSRHAGGGSFGAALCGLPDAEAAAELQREVQRLYLVSISHAFVDLCTHCSSLRPSAGIFSCASASDFTPIDAVGSGSFDRSPRVTEVSASGTSSPHDRRHDKPGPADGRAAVPAPPSLTSSPIWGSMAPSPSRRRAGSAASEPVINVAQMTQIVLGMHPLLELEEERFLPLFAQYKPDVGETAILEWGRLYLEQLAVTLRAHAAAATSAEEKEKALLVFTDLWRAMRRLHRFGEGKIWPAAALRAALCHLEPLLHVWVARDKELVLDHALADIAADVARAGWVRAGGRGADAGNGGGGGDRGGDGEAFRSTTDGAAGDTPHSPTVDTLFRALRGSDAVKGGWNPLFFLLPPPLARIALPALVSQFASALLSYCSLLTSGLPAGVPAEAVPAAARAADAAADVGSRWVGDMYEAVMAEAQMLRRRLHRQREALDAMRTFSPKEAARERSGYWGAFVVSLGLDSAAQRRCTALLDELNAHSLASLCVRAASASAVVTQLDEPHGLLALLRDAAQHAEWEGPPPSAAFGDVRAVFGEALEHIYEYIGVKVLGHPAAEPACATSVTPPSTLQSPWHALAALPFLQPPMPPFARRSRAPLRPELCRFPTHKALTPPRSLFPAPLPFTALVTLWPMPCIGRLWRPSK